MTETELINKILPRVIELQESIHKDPELSNHEERTRNKVCGFLENLGLNIHKNPNSFGFFADLEIDPHGETMAFRADMDALPIQEKNDFSYISKNPGIMHACGHDFHTAILAGTARVLANKKKNLTILKRNIRFIFQHAEENSPFGGAREMIENGALRNCTALFGLHLWPSLTTNSIAIRSGTLMGASDRITITIYGKSSHAACPESGIDSIVIAGKIISSIQTIISRKINPLDSAVITLGKIAGGDRYNVIAEKTILEGTIRTLNETTRNFIEKSLKSTVEGIAESFGGQAIIDYSRGYPILRNHEHLALWAADILKASIRECNILQAIQPSLTAEDFSFYAQKVPAVFMWLGCSPNQSPGEERFPLHNSAFCADQECIETGMRAFTKLALAPQNYVFRAS